MSEGCTHNCETCGSNCSERQSPQSLIEKLNEKSSVKKVYAVISGKGGVGKSSVTAMLATLMQRKGYKTAVLDADITGPSAPKIFGITQKAVGDEDGIYPVKTKTGIEVMSVNLLLPNETDPVVWRGPIIAGTVKQFWTDVIWGSVDYMFIDMPPGTGDIPITVFQSIPIDGIIIVTSPQQLVSMIVEKAVKMANMMDIPIISLVENLSYFKCDECGKEFDIFGESKVESTAKALGINHTLRLPVAPETAKLCDMGDIESFTGEWLNGLADILEK